MASSMTNRGRKLLLDYVFRGAALPANFYVALCTNAIVPTVDTNTFGELTEIAVGNGYTSGGFQLTPGVTDFDSLIEDDANDRADLQLKDVVWTAAGGNLPASGAGARWAVFTDDNATLANRNVIGAWDLTADLVVTDTQPLTLPNFTMRTKKPA